MPVLIEPNPFPKAICPFCGSKPLADPSRHERPVGPPTDWGDASYIKAWPVYATCCACGASIELPGLSRLWGRINLAGL